MSTDVIGEALRELVLDRKTQDSKNRLFFGFHQAHELCTTCVHRSQAHCEERATWLDFGGRTWYPERRLMEGAQPRQLAPDVRTQAAPSCQKRGIL